MQAPRIIILDPSVISQKILEAIAHRAGFQATLYTHSFHALQDISTSSAQTHPQLLILDLNVAPVKAYQMIKLVRARSPTLPILVITAHGTLEKIKARLVGAHACLEKPIIRADVVAKISALTTPTAS
jgi:DNA-binding response OmpR family regulator